MKKVVQPQGRLLVEKEPGLSLFAFNQDLNKIQYVHINPNI